MTQTIEQLLADRIQMLRDKIAELSTAVTNLETLAAASPEIRSSVTSDITAGIDWVGQAIQRLTY